MTDGQREVLRQRFSLLDYLQQQGWQPTRRSGGEEVAGLCPLHRETHPSFYVNRRKQVFYCHGCGRGGDLIRLVELLHGLGFRQALARLAPAGAGERAAGRDFPFLPNPTGRLPRSPAVSGPPRGIFSHSPLPSPSPIPWLPMPAPSGTDCPRRFVSRTCSVSNLPPPIRISSSASCCAA